MNDISYCNDMLVRLEELLFHELSGCAAWKVELVGIDFIQSKDVKGKTPDELIQNCIHEIKAAGLVEEMTHEIGGKGVKLELKMKGCVHLPKEAKLTKDGVKPYICPITNMILDQLIEKLNYESAGFGPGAPENLYRRCSGGDSDRSSRASGQSGERRDRFRAVARRRGRCG